MDKKPKIRFKGFDDAWEQRKLGEISEIVAGGDVDKLKIKDFGKFPVYANALTNDGIVGYYNDEYRISAPAVTVTGRGDVGHAQARTTNFTPVVRLLALKTKHNCDFIENAINRKKVIVESTGVPQLTVPQLENFLIEITNIAEQTKIGCFFKQLDNLITLHQRKYEKLKNIKKSMLEKMFPKNGSKLPEIRFNGFTDAWEQRKLGEVVQFYSGLTYSPNDITKNNGTLVIRSSNISDGEIIHSDDVYVNSNIVNSENVKIGDIIVVVRNGSRSLIGKHAQVKKMMSFTTIGAFMTGVRFSCPEFLNSLLSTTKFNQEIEKDLGATINQITTGSFKNMEFYFPKNDEQIKLGKFFTAIDHLITLHQRKLEKLKNIKKSMLEKMFV